jgi:hypothetical protein
MELQGKKNEKERQVAIWLTLDKQDGGIKKTRSARTEILVMYSSVADPWVENLQCIYSTQSAALFAIICAVNLIQCVEGLPGSCFTQCRVTSPPPPLPPPHGLGLQYLVGGITLQDNAEAGTKKVTKKHRYSIT